jgi:hypothetical protein
VAGRANHKLRRALEPRAKRLRQLARRDSPIVRHARIKDGK